MFAVVIGLLLTAGADAAVVTLQPGPEEGKDAYVYSSTDGQNFAAWNYGNAVDVRIRGDSYNSRRMHFFIEFDVSSLVPEDVVSVKFSALTFEYYKYASGSREIGIYKVTEEWIEGTGATPADGITHNDQPLFDSTPVATITVPSTITTEEEAAGGIWHVWDSDDTENDNAGFADLVKDWVSGATENYGMMVMLTAPTSTSGRPYHHYRSSDYGDGIGEDPLLRPMLEISDTGGPPVPIPGDANDNGVVDDEDASILASNWQYGPDATWGQGDFNRDGIVDDQDAAIQAAHWGESREGTAEVPEPGCIVLLLCGMVSLLFLARRRS
jgi:hypothetical protein